MKIKFLSLFLVLGLMAFGTSMKAEDTSSTEGENTTAKLEQAAAKIDQGAAQVEQVAAQEEQAATEGKQADDKTAPEFPNPFCKAATLVTKGVTEGLKPACKVVIGEIQKNIPKAIQETLAKYLPADKNPIIACNNWCNAVQSGNAPKADPNDAKLCVRTMMYGVTNIYGPFSIPAIALAPKALGQFCNVACTGLEHTCNTCSDKDVRKMCGAICCPIDRSTVKNCMTNNNDSCDNYAK